MGRKRRAAISASTKHPEPFPFVDLTRLYLSCRFHRLHRRVEVDHNRSVPGCYVVVKLDGRRRQLDLNNHRLLPVPGHVDRHPVEGVGGLGMLLGGPRIGESKQERDKEQFLKHFEGSAKFRHMWEGAPVYWVGRGGGAAGGSSH